MKLTIDVTQEDIDLGCKVDTTGDRGGCMVWRAFNRCTEGSFPVTRVLYENIHIYEDWDQMMRDNYGTAGKQISLPPDVMPKIQRFDKGLPVKPFSFEVDIPVKGE